MEFAKLPTFTEENVKLRSRAELEGFLMLTQRNVKELARENADLLAQIAELTQPPKEVEQPIKEVTIAPND